MLIILSIILTLAIRASAVPQYGIDYVLRDGTIISIPPINVVRANRMNETFLRMFDDNMTYIDNDYFINEGRMIFSTFTDGPMHILEPYVPLSDRDYGKINGNTSIRSMYP
ncbi:hypothetical protein V1520DRAFT_331979 [Lipomyces starkeyi]|uniref:Uncharacterized protein n=1 Tax=Lipomyces starkeyi NRRL Y-11557 TaxID=675824 RepID=A0A1E3Q4R0_LIPST|nr:hypothetical protein LIPSTDRAFT_314022 [Lipomyces starkeyi NRRL Y-11557]